LDIETNEAGGTAIDINNTGTGDPKINLQLNGTTTFSIGVDNDDADKLKIGTTAPETNTRVTIDNTGNVGVGTATPGAKLDVDGSAIFNESGSAVNFRVESDANANMLFIDGTNNRVGVGTGAPDATFQVNGSFKLVDGNQSNGKVLTSDANGVATWQTASGVSLPAGTSGQTLRYDGTNWVANSVLFNNGTNVGVGTASPGAKLDVDGSATFNESGSAVNFRIESDNNANMFFVDGTNNGIGVGTETPNTAAILDISSTTKGFAPPRMTTTQRNAITSPFAGLTIYNTTLNCMEYFNGTGWLNHCTGAITAPTGGNASSGGTAVVSTWTSTVGCSVGAGTNNSPAGVIRGGVNETMVQGVVAPATATITLVANVTTAGTYNIFTNTINGVTFSASGTFGATGNQTVTLTPTGTPTLAGNYTWATNLTPSINVYGSVITTSAPLGSSYTAHFNGITTEVSIDNTSPSYTTGEIFSNNTTCQNKPISAQGCAGVTSVTASSGRVHNTVNINGQCWLQTNLITVPTVYNNYTTGSWTNTSPGDQGYWGYYNTATTDGTAGWSATEPAANEGRLYQWCGAMDATISERSRGICPAGWHVPSDCEWMYLEHGQGMSIAQQTTNNAWRANDNDNQGTPGYKLRSAGTGFTNESNFSGLLAGYRNTNGTFNNRTSLGSWWSSSAAGATTASRRLLLSGGRGVSRYSDIKALGFSVRCLKD
jgi:uncharacterized protein (TIGR02145 family)